MQHDQSPGNDRLTKQFYETFLKHYERKSLQIQCQKGHFSTSKRQTIIRLIEKKDKDKGFIQNWRPISMLNVDLKLISKALSEKHKKVMQI